MVFRKGNQTAKDKAKSFFIEWRCPICGAILKIKPHEAKNKKTCGNWNCIKELGTWKIGVEKSAIAAHNKNIDKKNKIKIDIIQWVEDNKELVMNCPYNKISSTLKDLNNLMIEKYNIKDWRSIYICFEVKNLKLLLDKLKEIASSKENIC